MAATTSDEIPAWQAARARNAAHSPIHLLPTEILLQIMQYLCAPMDDWPLDLFFIRQTCSLFAELLASSPAWQHRERPRLSIIFDDGPLHPFPLPAMLETRLAFRRRMFESRPRCSTCAAYRTDDAQFAARLVNLQHQLNCSSCHWQHPAIAFAPGQRTRRIASWRTCIARSGRIPLCPHKSFKMHHLTSFMYPYPSEGEEIPPLSEREGRTPQGWLVVECKRCFGNFAAPGQKEMQLPTVFGQDAPIGSFTVRWAVPVARHRGRDDNLPTEAILAALPRLEANYKALLGPQSSFLSDRIRRAVLNATPEATPTKLPLDNSDERTLLLKVGEDGWVYLACNTGVALWGHTATGEVCDFTAFIPFLAPETVSLETDAEAKHVTWCPDPACKTGKGFDAHLLTVKSWDECARDDVRMRSQWDRNGGYPGLDALQAWRRCKGRKKLEEPFVPFPGTAVARQSEGGWFRSLVKGTFGG